MTQDMSTAMFHPGDTVLLGIDSSYNPENVGELQEKLHEHFPGVQFVFVSGLTTALVQRGDADGSH